MPALKNNGFTLIELVVAIGIVGILAAIAYPSYTEHGMKARRADAKAGLLDLQMAEERFRANCPSYATAIDSNSANYSCGTGTLTHSATSPDGHYTLSIVSANLGTDYRIRATRMNTGPQATDKCGDFEIDTSLSNPQTVVNAAAGYDATTCW